MMISAAKAPSVAAAFGRGLPQLVSNRLSNMLSRSKGKSSVGQGYWANVSRSALRPVPALYTQQGWGMVLSSRAYSQQGWGMVLKSRAYSQAARTASQQENVRQDEVREIQHSEYAPQEEGRVRVVLIPEHPRGGEGEEQPVWNDEELQAVVPRHRPPTCRLDRAALTSTQLIRRAIDRVSGYTGRARTEDVWLRRIVLTEAVAGVPCRVSAARYCLVGLHRDLVNDLLAQAETDRMHLKSALLAGSPSYRFRLGVVTLQGLMGGLITLATTFSPTFTHRLAAYMNEDAVLTYSQCLEHVNNGLIQHWQGIPAPDLAVAYWQLPEGSPLADVITMMRADEANHRDTNHEEASTSSKQ